MEVVRSRWSLDFVKKLTIFDISSTRGLTVAKSKTDTEVHRPRPSDERTETGDSPTILDWDACLETPPPRPAGRIKVRLNFLGRGKPIPLEGPECPENAASREGQ